MSTIQNDAPPADPLTASHANGPITVAETDGGAQ